MDGFWWVPSLREATTARRLFLFYFCQPPPPSSTTTQFFCFLHLLFLLLLLLLLLPSSSSAFWPTLQGNPARQGRLDSYLQESPNSNPSFLKWNISLAPNLRLFARYDGDHYHDYPHLSTLCSFGFVPPSPHLCAVVEKFEEEKEKGSLKMERLGGSGAKRERVLSMSEHGTNGASSSPPRFPPSSCVAQGARGGPERHRVR